MRGVAGLALLFGGLFWAMNVLRGNDQTATIAPAQSPLSPLAPLFPGLGGGTQK